jgi:hypothetical protein
LASDHGGPVWAVYRCYHNTVLRETPVFRDYFLMGLGAAGLRHNERDVFNNIFVQTDKVPGVGFAGITQAGNVREGGNLLWGFAEGPLLKDDPFAKFRASKLFDESVKVYGPGWTTNDRVADPKFVSLTAGRSAQPAGRIAAPCDLRLQAGSPAIDFGLTIPEEWPDPLRESGDARPDAGALPRGVDAWGVGVRGRIPLFGGKEAR